jgi:group I intron endonuclease
MIIYQVINLINNKIYIGQTINSLKLRQLRHLYDSTRNSQLIFHKAIRKYGYDNFQWSILCECENLDILNEMEIHYIKLFDTYHNGYNANTGGKNFKMSDETKMKISKATSGENHPLYGSKMSEETKNKIRDKHMGKITSDETKKKLSILGFNRIQTDECKKKVSEANIGRTHSDETKEKISKIMKGKVSPRKGVKLSIETKEKMSKSRILKYSKK